jgi:hypothetical protein
MNTLPYDIQNNIYSIYYSNNVLKELEFYSIYKYIIDILYIGFVEDNTYLKDEITTCSSFNNFKNKFLKLLKTFEFDENKITNIDINNLLKKKYTKAKAYIRNYNRKTN